jgi:hypothetical protein
MLLFHWEWHLMMFFKFVFQVQAGAGLSRERPDSSICCQCWFLWCQMFVWNKSQEKHTPFLSGPAQKKCGKHVLRVVIDWLIERWNFSICILMLHELQTCIWFLLAFLLNLMLESHLLAILKNTCWLILLRLCNFWIFPSTQIAIQSLILCWVGEWPANV